MGFRLQGGIPGWKVEVFLPRISVQFASEQDLDSLNPKP